MSTNNLKQKDYFFSIFIIISILLIISLSRGILDILGTKDRFIQAEQEVKELEAKNQAIKDEIDKSNHDLVTESIIRDELGLAKPGDIVVIIPEELLESRLKDQTSQETNQNLPNWQKWAEVFGF